nr:hypothetical protein [Rhodococcus sp. 14-1411-2a]
MSSNRVQISFELISVPVESVSCWTTRAKSICNLRASSRPWSTDSRYAIPPFPDWLFTRMTAS